MSRKPKSPDIAVDAASRAPNPPVHGSFDRAMHVHKGDLTQRAHGLLIVSIKPAPCPTVVTLEMNPTGRLNVYDAHCAPDMHHAGQFGEEIVLPLLKQRHGESHYSRSFVLLVPAAPSLGDMTDAWSMQFCVAMEECRGQIRFVDPSMQIQGLAAAERFITGSADSPFDSSPKLLICEKNAKMLITALSDEYRYAEDSQGRQVPEISHPHSDLAAAFHHGCLFAERRGAIGRTNEQSRSVVMEGAAGWA